MTFGRAEVKEFSNKLFLANKTRSSIENGLMCRGYDLSKAHASGVIFGGSEAVLRQVPAKHIDYTYKSVKEILTRGTVLKGIYTEESLKDRLVVFSVFSGLRLPEPRIEELKEDYGNTGSRTMELVVLRVRRCGNSASGREEGDRSHCRG